ncbi:MAG: DUF3794 domain-containing protein [Clostridiales bacterium]|jgi:hypothetical protein|nr:DUF3794 domain-containing protein [Clostridiales bacterium]
MEVTLQRESIGLFRKLADTCFNHEETMELIVPDTLPDVLDIVDTDGTVLLRSKEADIGKITVSGVVRTHIIFVPEGGRGLRNLTVQIPISATVDGNEFTPSTKLFVKAELASIDTRIINSRKLIARADVMFSISAYSEAELQVSTGIADDTEIEVLKTNAEINPIVEVKEKVFSFSDEQSFSSSKPPIGAILKSSVRLAAEDLKTVGSKLIIKGNAYISVIYTSSGSGEIIPNDFTVPFSQIMELNEESENTAFSVGIMPTGIYIQESTEGTAGSHGISVEIAAVSQLIVWKKMNIQYIADAYSTAWETNCTRSENSVNSLVSENTIRDNVRGTISTPNQVRTVVGSRIFPGRVRQDENGYKVVLNAAALYLTEEGKIMLASDIFEIPFGSETDQGTETAAELNINEAFVSPAAGGVELRIPVELKLREYANIIIEPLSGIELDEEKQKDSAGMPSVVLCRVGANDSLWSLAKRYNSTRELIKKANLKEEGDEISPNELLIIAKKR